MKCPTCGAENDPANRFCDQCGTRLDAAAPAPAQPLAEQPTAAATTCPNCGAAVLPGEAFCDECGAPLNAAPVVAAPAPAAQDMPTVAVPVTSVSNEPAAGGDSVVCPACGHRNLPGEAFCDNCGASLAQATSAAPTAQASAASDAAPAAVELTTPPVVSGDGELPEDAPPAADQLFPAQPAEDQAETEAPAVEPASSVEVPADADTAATNETAGTEPAEAAAPAAEAAPSAAPAQPDYEAERTRLTDEIARQDQIIAQFEQMQSMFGASTPPAVVQGLDEARNARAQAESALNALVPAAPAIDPEEVARLQAEIARQDQIIAQFEQMQAMFGANTPPAVAQGLADARAGRDQAASELQALTGAAAPSAAPAPAMPPLEEAAPAAAPAEQPPAPATPAPAPQAHVPRLVVESNGAEIPLQLNKTELIIGREDPISGIFPEVDLTPYGGESGGVSRQHAKLVNTNGQWAVVDLNSTNYTRVDGTKLDPNVPAPVRDGSRIQLGRVVVLFQE